MSKVNEYVTKRSSLTAVEKLSASIANRNKKTKNPPKQQLSLLRELCIHLAAGVEIDGEVLMGIIDQMGDLSDQDADRKVLRACAYVLTEALQRKDASAGNQQMAVDAITLFTKEVNRGSNSPNVRQFLVYRVLGALSRYNQSHHVNLSTDEALFKVLCTALKDLKHAGKQRKSMFGSDKDHLTRMLHWNSLMQPLAVLTTRALPKECYANVFYGVVASYQPLVRNSLRALLNTASLAADDQSVLELASMLLDRKKKGKEYLNLDDDLSAAYFLRCVAALAGHIDWSSATAASETRERVLDLFVATADLLKSSSRKVACEAAVLFIGHSSSSWLVLGHLYARKAPRVYSQIVETLIHHCTQLPCDSYQMPLLYRTCVQLGRFSISRPYETSDPLLKPLCTPAYVEKDGEALIPLWVALKKHHYKRLIVPASLPSNLAALQAHHMATPAQSHTYSSCDNVRVAHPHMLCAAVTAFLWLAPDLRYCRRDHGLLWVSFSSNLIETVDALSALRTDAPAVCESLLQPLLANLFCRVRLSTLVDRWNDSRPTAAVSSEPDLLFDPATSSAPPSKAARVLLGTSLHFCAAYCDALTSVAQRIFAKCPCNQSIAHFEAVWDFLALLTRADVTQPDSSTTTTTDSSTAGQSDLLTLLHTGTPHSTSLTSDSPHRVHCRTALLRSLLAVVAMATEGAQVDVSHAQQQTALNLHEKALWYLAENICLWTGVGAIKECSPEPSLLQHSSLSNETVSASSAVVSLLSAAALHESGSLQKTAVLGLIKVAGLLYLPSVLRGQEVPLSLDASLASQLLHSLLRCLLAHFPHCLASSSSSSGLSLQDTVLSVRVAPQSPLSTQTLGDYLTPQKATRSAVESVLSALLGPTATVPPLYGSLASTVLVLFAYTLQSTALTSALAGETTADLLLLPLPHRHATFTLAKEPEPLPEPPATREPPAMSVTAAATAHKQNSSSDGFDILEAAGSGAAASTAAASGFGSDWFSPSSAKDASAASDWGADFTAPTAAVAVSSWGFESSSGWNVSGSSGGSEAALFSPSSAASASASDWDSSGFAASANTPTAGTSAASTPNNSSSSAAIKIALPGPRKTITPIKKGGTTGAGAASAFDFGGEVLTPTAAPTAAAIAATPESVSVGQNANSAFGFPEDDFGFSLSFAQSALPPSEEPALIFGGGEPIAAVAPAVVPFNTETQHVKQSIEDAFGFAEVTDAPIPSLLASTTTPSKAPPATTAATTVTPTLTPPPASTTASWVSAKPTIAAPPSSGGGGAAKAKLAPRKSDVNELTAAFGDDWGSAGNTSGVARKPSLSSVASSTDNRSTPTTSGVPAPAAHALGDDLFGGRNRSATHESQASASHDDLSIFETSSVTSSHSHHSRSATVPTLPKPVVPTLAKPAAKLSNPFQGGTAAGGGQTAASKRLSVAASAAVRKGELHSDLMGLSGAIAATRAPPVDPFGPSSSAPIAPTSSAPVDPFAASSSFSTTSAASAAPPADPFAPSQPSSGFEASPFPTASSSSSSVFAPSSASDFAPSAAGTAVPTAAAAPSDGFTPSAPGSQPAYPQYYPQQGAYYGYPNPAQMDPAQLQQYYAAAAAYQQQAAVYYQQQQQAYGSDPTSAAAAAAQGYGGQPQYPGYYPGYGYPPQPPQQG